MSVVGKYTIYSTKVFSMRNNLKVQENDKIIMIPTEVFTCVFHLKFGSSTGTCFEIDYKGKKYIVTAKHILRQVKSGKVVKELKNNDFIEISHNQKWISQQATLIGHHESADISVISIDNIMTELILECSSTGMVYGQEAYFLGFPYNMYATSNADSKVNRYFPMPLVKKAIISGVVSNREGDYLLLDGINNRGGVRRPFSL